MLLLTQNWPDIIKVWWTKDGLMDSKWSKKMIKTEIRLVPEEKVLLRKWRSWKVEEEKCNILVWWCIWLWCITVSAYRIQDNEIQKHQKFTFCTNNYGFHFLEKLEQKPVLYALSKWAQKSGNWLSSSEANIEFELFSNLFPIYFGKIPTLFAWFLSTYLFFLNKNFLFTIKKLPYQFYFTWPGS